MRYGARGPSWLDWVRACETWPVPWEAVHIPGALWWLTRVLAYRDLKYAIEHEQPINEADVEWPADEGW